MIASFSAQFTWVDWGVVIAYLVLTSWIGAKMAGRQATIHDFFLGGRKLPWYAVSGSIVASEISALTFVSVPWVVCQPGGNLTYLQLGIFGSTLARIIVGYWLVPVYYRREIYSPFDYMHNELGGGVRSMTTVLFIIKAMLAQSSRIYLASEVIVVVLNDQLVWMARNLGLNELAWAIIIISAVSIAWTLLGGMRTVIWTDVALFACFTVGALVALGTVAFALTGGIAELFRVGWGAKLSGFPELGLPVKESGAWGKFTFFDWSTSPTRTYTMWTALIASTWGGIGSYGLDQTLAQRMFCCKDVRDARWAIISSAVSQLVTMTVALVGIGLYAYYRSHPLTGQALELFKSRGDRILPIFVVEVVPMGFKGMIIAAIFAAAISTMMGVLTATSQTSLTAFYLPLRRWQLRRAARGKPPVVVEGCIAVDLECLNCHYNLRTLSIDSKCPECGSPVSATMAGQRSVAGHHPDSAVSQNVNVEHLHDQGAVSDEDRRTVRVSRILVLFWGVTLALISYLTLYMARYYPSILDLGLAMAGYILGALLAGFLLSFLPLRVDSRGFMYAAPLSCMCVFALIWHQPWTHWVCWTFAAVTLVIWVGRLIVEAGASASRPPRVLPAALQTLILLEGLAFMMWLNYYGFWDGGKNALGEPIYVTVAWPWEIPLGSAVAFIWGYLLARRRVA